MKEFVKGEARAKGSFRIGFREPEEGNAVGKSNRVHLGGGFTQLVARVPITSGDFINH